MQFAQSRNRGARSVSARPWSIEYSKVLDDGPALARGYRIHVYLYLNR